MDDILIATSTSLQDHRDATHDILDLLQEHNLFLKKKKCRWGVDSIDYLGLILEKGDMHGPDQSGEHQKLAQTNES